MIRSRDGNVVIEFDAISRLLSGSIYIMIVETFDNELDFFSYNPDRESQAIEQARDFVGEEVMRITTYRATGGKEYRNFR